MDVPIPVGTCRATAKGEYGAAHWENVFYFTVTPHEGSSGNETCIDIDQAVQGFYTTAFTLPRLSVDFSVSKTTILWRDAEDSIVRKDVADAVVGSAAGTPAPGQVCYLVNWDNTDPRRGGKPRTYVCGVPEDTLGDPSEFTPDVVTAVGTGLATWLDNISAGAYSINGTLLDLVEMSFTDNKTERAVAVPFVITGGSLNPVVGTQRRRVGRLRF